MSVGIYRQPYCFQQWYTFIPYGLYKGPRHENMIILIWENYLNKTVSDKKKYDRNTPKTITELQASDLKQAHTEGWVVKSIIVRLKL